MRRRGAFPKKIYAGEAVDLTRAARRRPRGVAAHLATKSSFCSSGARNVTVSPMKYVAPSIVMLFGLFEGGIVPRALNDSNQ